MRSQAWKSKFPGTATPALVSIDVTPATPSIVKGSTQQMVATGNYADASTADLTALVTWASATPAAATVSASGLVTAVAGGTSSISATLDVISGSTTVTVTQRRYPANATQWGTYFPTVLAPDNLWTMQENGLPSDQIGSRPFTATSVTPPTYNNATTDDGRVSVKFTAGTTLMRTGTTSDYDMSNATSNRRMTVWLRLKIPPQVAFVQQTILAHMLGGVGWRLQLGSSGELSFEMFDGNGHHSYAVNYGNHMDDAWHDVFLIIDRTAVISRCISDLGDSGDNDISNMVNTASAGYFRFGYGTVNVPTGMELDYAAGWYGTTANRARSAADFATLLTPV